MQTVIRLFLKGLATLVPIALTLAILYWLGSIAEHSMGAMIAWFLPEPLYIPGMGLVAGLALVIAIGLLSHLWLFRSLFDLGEALLDRVPLVKSVFRAIKDFVDYFSAGDQRAMQTVVKLTHPALPVTVLGFITREDFSELPYGGPGEVAVYLPMSYQIGGYTVIVPREWVQPLDMRFEDAMRTILTASVSRQSGSGRG